MKKVVFILSAVLITTVFISCKNEKPNILVEEKPETEAVKASEDLAMAEANELEANNSSPYLYVLAPSGLSLRQHDNLHSERLAKMPYGTRVKVITAQEEVTMNVGGIKGGMTQVEFNHKKGFAFNGYLSKYFPPEQDITPKGYVAELNQLFPKVAYESLSEGTASNPTTIEIVLLPNVSWHEAFFIAQRLFDFPKEFDFPNPRGSNSETVKDKKPKKEIWTSQLEISRKDHELQKIEYVYGSKKFDATVRIEAHDDGMRISKSETIK